MPMGKRSAAVAVLWRAGLGGALVVVLAGCWEMPGQGPDRRAHNPFEKTISNDNVHTLKVAWSVDTGPTLRVRSRGVGRRRVRHDSPAEQ